MALVDTGPECSLMHGNALKFSGPLGIIEDIWGIGILQDQTLCTSVREFCLPVREIKPVLGGNNQ